METKLPNLTPKEVREWVERVENIYPVNALKYLPENASLKDIEEAFYTDRNTLIGIGENLMMVADWDAWESYQDSISNEI